MLYHCSERLRQAGERERERKEKENKERVREIRRKTEKD